MLKRVPVSSSQIASVGYDAPNKKLHVEFHSGKVAEYDDIDRVKADALMASESKGKFFHAHVRGNEAHPWRYV